MDSRVQPILWKDSANEWNIKRKAKLSYGFPSAAYLWKDSANEWNIKRNAIFFFYKIKKWYICRKIIL